MSREHQRRVARLEGRIPKNTITAVGQVPVSWTDDQANRAIAALARAEGSVEPLEVMALRDVRVNAPKLIGTCDLSDVLATVAGAGCRITDSDREIVERICGSHLSDLEREKWEH